MSGCNDSLRPPVKKSLFSPQVTRLLEVGCIGAVFLFYVLLKAKTLRITAADEGVYFYAAKLWLSGLMPYRDFFISHPPLHLLESLMPMALFGVNIRLFNAIPSLFLSSASGFLVFRIAKREWGFLAGFLSALFFLFSSNQVLQSNHMTGINLTLFFLLSGLDAFLLSSYLISGVCLGAGFMSGAYALPGFLLLALVALLTRPSSLRPFATGFLAIVVPFHLLFLLLAGRAFIEDVYLYHLAKAANSPYFANVPSVMIAFVREERWLVFPALLGIHMFFFSQFLKKKTLLPLSSSLAALSCLFLTDYLLFFSLMSRVFRHYLLLAIPFGALLAVFGLLTLYSVSLPISKKKSWIQTLYQSLVACGIGATFSWFLLASIAPYGRVAFTYVFSGAHDVALYLQKTLAPGETLYGDFGVTPTVALLSGIRIAANEVDSSIMRFEKGFSSPEKVIEALENDHIGALIIRQGTDIELEPTFRKYSQMYFTPTMDFVGADSSGSVEVWLRKKNVPFTGVPSVTVESHPPVHEIP